MAEHGRSGGRSDDRSTGAVDDAKEWLEYEAMPSIDAIKAQMTTDERQSAFDGILARVDAAISADEAAGRTPETPIQVAVSETLAELKAAPTREHEDEILNRFRARSKEFIASWKDGLAAATAALESSTANFAETK